MLTVKPGKKRRNSTGCNCLMTLERGRSLALLSHEREFAWFTLVRGGKKRLLVILRALGIDSRCPFVARQEPCPPEHWLVERRKAYLSRSLPLVHFFCCVAIFVNFVINRLTDDNMCGMREYYEKNFAVIATNSFWK